MFALFFSQIVSDAKWFLPSYFNTLWHLLVFILKVAFNFAILIQKVMRVTSGPIILLLFMPQMLHFLFFFLWLRSQFILSLILIEIGPNMLKRLVFQPSTLSMIFYPFPR